MIFFSADTTTGRGVWIVPMCIYSKTLSLLPGGGVVGCGKEGKKKHERKIFGEEKKKEFRRFRLHEKRRVYII